jgi:hypothetical protein
MGHGLRTEMSSADAIALAASSDGHAPVQVAAGLGFNEGDSVTVAAIDYGTEGVTGTLVGLDLEQVSLARRDERAGLVHVHFPRLGFDLRPAA